MISNSNLYIIIFTRERERESLFSTSNFKFLIQKRSKNKLFHYGLLQNVSNILSGFVFMNILETYAFFKLFISTILNFYYTKKSIKVIYRL